MNPDHPRFADWDSAYVIGALSPAERREYEEHLETCETCRRSVAFVSSCKKGRIVRHSIPTV